MWLVFAFLSAVFSGMTWILAKFAAKQVDPVVATALRSLVLLGGAWMAVILSGGWRELADISRLGVVTILLSGVATGLAWLFYLRALSLGGMNQAAALDKGSILLTVLGGWLFLDEAMSGRRWLALTLILIGILLMIRRKSIEIDKNAEEGKGHGWLLWGVLSVVLTAVSALLSKVGVGKIQSDLALALRTGVVMILCFLLVLGGEKVKLVGSVARGSYFVLIFSGVAASLAWICYFRALRGGEAGAVHAIDKLNVLITALGGRLFFGERLSRRETIGLGVLTAGVLVLAVS